MLRKGFLTGGMLTLALSASASAAPFTVSNTNDSGTDSLRKALTDANANGSGETDTITITATGTITAGSALPAINTPTIVDGPDGAARTVRISGSGLTINAAGSTIQDVAITGSPGYGIDIQAASATVRRCWIGLDLGGNAAANANGINVAGANAVIGAASAGNVIGSNSGDGITVAAAGASVKGNFVGMSTTGLAARANLVGIRLVNGAVDARIGGGASGEPNYISGNTSYGVYVNSGPIGTEITSNIIGLAANDTTALPNSSGIKLGETATVFGNTISGNISAGILATQGSGTIRSNWIGLNAAGSGSVANGVGVLISGGTNVTVGGSTSNAEGNTISGNTTSGIEIQAGATTPRIYGNTIGLRNDGTAVANGANGILVDGGDRTYIGDSTPADRNTISGNAESGIRVTGGTAWIIDNYIGTNIVGTVDRYGATGVRLDTGTNLILGDGAGGALISGNALDGVLIAAGTNNTVRGSYIGLAANGAALGNDGSGVEIRTSGNSIGTGLAGADSRNIIGSNGSFGVDITSSDAFGNVIKNNAIGVFGTSARPNGGDGVIVHNDAHDNTIGGTGPYEGNEIAYSANGKGLAVFDKGGNRIRGNLFHHLTSFAIDLFGGNRHSDNDVNDVDTGGNNVQNHPTFVQARRLGNQVRIYGLLDTNPGAGTYGIDAFLTSGGPTGCSSGGNDCAYGPGDDAVYAGAFDIAKGAPAAVAIDQVITSPVDPTGKLITLTATSPGGDTSEFSARTSASPGSTVVADAATKQVSESAGSVTLHLTRTMNFGDAADATVTVATVGGTATAGEDFTAAPVTASFPAGATAADVAVPILSDTVYEGDETLTVTLGGPVGVDFIGSPGATTITILEDDPAPPPAATGGTTPGGTAPGGTTPGGTDGGTTAAAPPAISALALKAKKKRPAAVSFTSSAAGRVRLTFARVLVGRLVAKRCVKTTRKNRTRPKCTRTAAVKGAVMHAAAAGANRFTFSGKVAGKRLPPGRYVVTAVGVGADGRLGAPVTARVTLKR